MLLNYLGEIVKRKRRLAGLLFIYAATLAILVLPVGDHLEKWSYDLPFLFRGNITDSNVVILVEDRASLDALGYAEFPPSRTVHAQLVDKLRAEGADLVVFDIYFRNARPGEDESFADAIRRHGRVILGGVVETTMQQLGDSSGARLSETRPPTDELQHASLDWGLVVLGDLDANLGVRKMVTQWKGTVSASWLAAQYTGALAADADPQDERWINFYGPTPALDQVTLGEVLGAGERTMPPGFLKGKVVFVGFDSSVAPASAKRDVFATPYTRAGGEFTPGVEILANVYANLANRDWLRRASLPMQALIAFLFATIAFAALLYTRRRWIWLTVSILFLLLLASSVVLQWTFHFWWNWTVPAIVQLPLTTVLVLLYPRLPVVAFISYRRRGGDAFAMALLSQLRARGKDALIDINEITSGEFPDQIFSMIDRVPTLLLVLSPDALNDRINNPDDWMRKEIVYAIEKKKSIIPIFLEGFDFKSCAQLPAGMERIKELHGIHHHYNTWDATLKKVETYLE